MKTFLLLSLLISQFAQAIDVSFEKDSSLPLVYINLAVKAGSAADPSGQLGLTNFMGEMLMRGTSTRTKEQIDMEIDQMGSRLDVETRAESLIFRGAVITSQLEPFLRLLADLITRPKFPEHEIRKLKAQIISTITEELGEDTGLASRYFNSFFFGSHSYGNPVLGKIKDLQKLSRAQVVSHYERLLRDQELVVVGAGDAEPALVQTWASTLANARPGGEPLVTAATNTSATRRRLLIVDKPDRTQTQIMGGLQGILMTDSRYFALHLANHVFGGRSFLARLMMEIRVKNGWSYGAYSFFRMGTQPRLWQLHLFPASKDTPAALASTIKLLEEFQNKGVTQDEFNFARKSLINGSGFLFDTPEKRIENRLLEISFGLPAGFMQSYPEQLRKLTLEQVNSAVKDFFHPNRLAITVLGTASVLKDSLAQASGVPVGDIEVLPYNKE